MFADFDYNIVGCKRLVHVAVGDVADAGAGPPCLVFAGVILPIELR